MKNHFTDKDFTVILNKPKIEVGMNVIFDDKAAKIIKLSGNNGDDYCVIELEHEYRGCKVLEIRKSEFNYLTYPK